MPLCITFTDANHICFYWIKNNSQTEACYIILNQFKSGIIYYAHNLLFDFLLIINILLLHNIKYSWIYINYNLYEVKIFYLSKIIILRCSHKLIPFSINQFFPTFSKKQKLYYPYEVLSDWNPAALCLDYPLIDSSFYNLNINDYTIKYTKQNMLILKEGLSTFFSNLKILGIPFSKKNLSCSSISFNFYIKKFNKIKLNLSAEIKNIANQAYFGGRCEVYGNPRVGEKILHFDFSSMYFHCMQEELPYGDFVFKDTDLDLTVPGFYYISVRYFTKYPILPTKSDKLYFKEGDISGWFWYEEINLLLKNIKCVDFKLKCGFISTKNEKILLEFLNTLEQIKDADSIKRKIGKLLINSFYGRLAIGDEMSIIELVTELSTNKSYGKLNEFYVIKKKY